VRHGTKSRIKNNVLFIDYALEFWYSQADMLIGYARVSTQDQTLHLQIDALKAAGCDPDHIYTDTISGATADRPGLRESLSHLRAGDTRACAHLLYRSVLQETIQQDHPPPR